MTAAAGFVGLQLAFALVGMTLLFALRLVARPRDAFAALGAAYLAGVALVLSALILLLVLGAGVALPALALTCALLAAVLSAVGLVRALRSPAAALPPPRAPAASAVERWLPRIGALALALYFAVGLSAYAKLPTVGDDWAIWSYKGVLLYDYDHLFGAVWHGHFPHPAHLDYPILQPLLEALTFRAMGGIHLQQFHITLFLLFAAFIGTVWFLLRSRAMTAGWMLAPLAALALSPSVAYFVSTGYADATVACFAGAGALAVGLWLDRGGLGYGLLGAVLLAGAANSKNEGQLAALAVFVTALGVLVFTRAGRWREWLAAAGLALAGAAPWIVWRSHRGIRNDDVPPLSKTLHLHYLGDRLDRLGMAVGKLFAQLASQGGWIWVVPCFLALAIACFATRTARRQAAFYLGTTTLMMLSLYWAYWTGTFPMPAWLTVSADRVVTGVVLTAGVGTMHLLAVLLRREPEAAGVSGGGGGAGGARAS